MQNQQKVHLLRSKGVSYLKRFVNNTSKDLPLTEVERPKDRYTPLEIKKILLKTSFSPARSIADLPNFSSQESPTPQTILNRFKRSDLEEVLEQTNLLLKKKFQLFLLRVKKKKLFFAVDGHSEPYYGKPTSDTSGGRRMKSTNLFHKVVALYFVHPGRMVLVSLSLMGRTEAETAQKMLEEVNNWLPTNRVLLADASYFTVIFLCFLRENNWDYIIHGAKRGKKLKTLLKSEKVQKLSPKEGFILPYEVRNSHNQKEKTFLVVGRRKNQEINLLVTSMARKGAKRLIWWYERRFRIETSFRDSRPYLIYSCSRDGRVRFQIIILALIIYTFLQYLFLTEPSAQSTLKKGQFLKCPNKQRLVAHHTFTFWEAQEKAFQGGDL